MQPPRNHGDEKRRVLKEVFGFDDFRPGQEQAVDALLAGRNVLTVMPTGSGKSLCFQVPALVQGGITIVVSPLVALMRDQVAALRLAGVGADAINSSRSRAENVAAWRRELDYALAQVRDHLSVYQLTIEPGTAFHQAHRRGELTVPSGDDAAALYEATQAALAAAGLPAYEISNHAAPGAACRHNLTYWRYGDYAGIGPGAHGRLTLDGEKLATRQRRGPEEWLADVEAAGHGTEARAVLDLETRRAEMTMMGLRLATGIARDDFVAETGAGFEAAFPAGALDDGRQCAEIIGFQVGLGDQIDKSTGHQPVGVAVAAIERVLDRR